MLAHRWAALAAVLAAILAPLSAVPARAATTHPASLPTDRLHFGLSNSPGSLSWMTGSGVPCKYRYAYLAGGVDTGSGWQTWQDPALPPGQYALDYMRSSAGAAYIPADDDGGYARVFVGRYYGAPWPPGPAVSADAADRGPGRGPGFRSLCRGPQRGVPGSGVTAVALNVTAANPTAPSFVAVYPDGAGWAVTSDLNTAPGRTSTNLVIVKLGSGGFVDLANAAGATDLIVDVAGWYS